MHIFLRLSNTAHVMLTGLDSVGQSQWIWMKDLNEIIKYMGTVYAIYEIIIHGFSSANLVSSSVEVIKENWRQFFKLVFYFCHWWWHIQNVSILEEVLCIHHCLGSTWIACKKKFFLCSFVLYIFLFSFPVPGLSALT